MNHESNKFSLEGNRLHKRQRVADDEPQAYAGADENSSDSDGEVYLDVMKRTFRCQFQHRGCANCSVLGIVSTDKFKQLRKLLMSTILCGTDKKEESFVHS